MTAPVKTNTVPIAPNLLHQAIAYLKQHDDPMAKMLLAQFQFALCQEKERQENRSGDRE